MALASVSQSLLTMSLSITGSAFFSAAETGIMTANRYRLRHQAKLGNRSAQRILDLLSTPDRLLSLILMGNALMNVTAGSAATLLGLRISGDSGVALFTGLLTFVLLIFGEVGPKTFAAAYPERVAYPAAWVLSPLLFLTRPLVDAIQTLARLLFRFRMAADLPPEELNSDELRTLVHESDVLPNQRRGMLLGVLDLASIRVNDIMVPRQEVVGIDINAEVDAIIEQLRSIQHTRLPVYRGELNDCIGILHIRQATRFLNSEQLTRAEILQHVREPYYVPEGTSLPAQLRNFQKRKQRMGLVVDEYGDIQGLVTLEDILEEIVGDFTTDGSPSPSFQREADGSYLLEGSLSLRELNRRLHWQLPVDGARTLSGLIIEHLDTIPEFPVSLRIGPYIIEVVQMRDNTVRSARVHILEPERE